MLTLDGLAVPDGGFDVIYCSGVIHHLSDPVEGLKNLRRVLAPHGIIDLMVYAKEGRRQLQSMIDAVNLAIPLNRPITERLRIGRMVARVAEKRLIGTPWANPANLHDTEFVDCVLHSNALNYDLPLLWDHMREADLGFVRWIEPNDWTLENLAIDAELKASLGQMSELEVYRFIELIVWKINYEMIVAPNANSPRTRLSSENVDSEIFCVNPDVTFIQENNNHFRHQTVNTISYKLRTRRPEKASGLKAVALELLSSQINPFDALSWIKSMASKGVSTTEARGLLIQLTDEDFLYRPHRSEI